MSDTPRTELKIIARVRTSSLGEREVLEYVEPDFARQLERELAMAISEIDELVEISRNGRPLPNGFGVLRKAEQVQKEIYSLRLDLAYYKERLESHT